MTRLSLLLSALPLALVAVLPLLHARQRHETYRNFRVVEEGVLYRSGQMSPDGFERVCREKGIRTVLSLRDEETQVAGGYDEGAYCDKHDIVFESISPKGWEEENGVVPMAANLREFERNLDALATDPILDPVTGERKLMYPRPILVHCFAGIHRTGAHVAVYRVKYNGYTPDEAVAELLSCGKPTTTYVGNLIPFLQTRYLPDLAERVEAGRIGVPPAGR
jgi:protein tyrosine/serine phosphatase